MGQPLLSRDSMLLDPRASAYRHILETFYTAYDRCSAARLRACSSRFESISLRTPLTKELVVLVNLTKTYFAVDMRWLLCNLKPDAEYVTN